MNRKSVINNIDGIDAEMDEKNVVVEAKNERIIEIPFDKELKSSYYEYAASVIADRAIPDVRDGLKPVQRRVLFAMKELGLDSSSSHKKSARIVGETMGKYHPHGDSSIYETMVRMAQSFSMRLPLVDGQGNFGSIDGDPAAAMRYTEARTSVWGEEIYEDIKENCVDWNPNFDDSLEEPSVLPTRLPNLLINGSQGVAVGMATNIPPHNPIETVKGIIAFLEKGCSMNSSELAEYVRGPDFPCGGIIMGTDGVEELYRTGRGHIVVRGRAFVEQSKNRNNIVVTEIPYGNSKTRVIESMSEALRKYNVDGVSAIRDESDRTGMRIVVELHKRVDPEPVLEMLYAKSCLQSTFGANCLALKNGAPFTMNLADMTSEFVDFRKKTVFRRTKDRLDKKEKRLHIVEGFMKLLSEDVLDSVISSIRESSNQKEALSKLVAVPFDFSTKQAEAILDFKLHRLTRIDVKELEKEKKSLEKDIRKYSDILSSEKKLEQELVSEYKELLERFEKSGICERRTSIENSSEKTRNKQIPIDFAVKNPSSFIICSDDNGRIWKKEFKTGRATLNGGAIDFSSFAKASNGVCYAVGYDGKSYAREIGPIPEIGERKMCSIEDVFEDVRKIVFIDGEIHSHVLFVWKNGDVKRMKAEDAFDFNPSRRRYSRKIIPETTVESLVSIIPCAENDELVVYSKNGKILRISSEEFRPQGAGGRGTSGMKLKDDDSVIGCFTMTENSKGDMIFFSDALKAKKINSSDIKIQKRNGSGVYGFRNSQGGGNLSSVCFVPEDSESTRIYLDDKNKIYVEIDPSEITGSNIDDFTVASLFDLSAKTADMATNGTKLVPGEIRIKKDAKKRLEKSEIKDERNTMDNVDGNNDSVIIDNPDSNSRSEESECEKIAEIEDM